MYIFDKKFNFLTRNDGRQGTLFFADTVSSLQLLGKVDNMYLKHRFINVTTMPMPGTKQQVDISDKDELNIINLNTKYIFYYSSP